MALLYMLWRRYEKSEKILLDLLDLDATLNGARSLLTMLYLMSKQWDKALKAAEESVLHVPDHPALRLNLAQALAGVGNAAEARRALDQAEHQFGADVISPFQRGQLHVLLGEIDDAFREFEAAIKRRTAAIYHLPLDPGLEDLHQDPRWSQLIARHGFPNIVTAGWRATAIDEWRDQGGGATR